MVLIIGAGLSGLLTASRLKNAGIPFKILEARSRIGGRIHTISDEADTPMEMGATWFNHQHQHLIGLLEDLGIARFEQYMTGTTFYQRYADSPAEIVNMPAQMPSYRISGGTESLINKLYDNLDPSDILLNQQVSRIKLNIHSITVEANESHEASSVVLAVPPRVWAGNIAFEPSLPTDLLQVAKHTQTWMEDAIKVSVSYDSPFWRKKNQAGTFFSNSGPIVEFYDHSNVEVSKFALCGFVHSDLRNLNYENRKDVILNHLGQTFGKDALSYIAYNECLWSEEKYTSIHAENPLQRHQNNGHPILNNHQLDNRLFISSTEVSSHYSGYMEGAVYQGDKVAKAIIQLTVVEDS